MAERWEDEHFGNCPQCGFNGEYRNLRKDHWFICQACRTKWYVGSNLLSSWQHESEEDWTRNAVLLNTYREVEPFYPEKGHTLEGTMSVEEKADCLPWEQEPATMSTEEEDRWQELVYMSDKWSDDSPRWYKEEIYYCEVRDLITARLDKAIALFEGADPKAEFEQYAAHQFFLFLREAVLKEREVRQERHREAQRLLEESWK